jgi:hypothetical protein
LTSPALETEYLIVGAYQAELSGKTLIGKSYVVFGKANNSAICINNGTQINSTVVGFTKHNNSAINLSAIADANTHSTVVGFTKHNIRFTYIGYII